MIKETLSGCFLP